jgi:hypothetical protein
MVAVFPTPGAAEITGEVPFPAPVAHVSTWNIDDVAVLSTKAIFFPSSDNTGEVRIRPPATVAVLYEK